MIGHAVGELPCGSQPTAPTSVVWSWRLKECFALAWLSSFKDLTAIPCWWAPIRAKRLSMAAPALVIWLCACVKHWPVNRPIGHFRVPKTLTFKMSPSAQPFLWKWVLFALEWKIISKSKGWALNFVLIQRSGWTRKLPINVQNIFLNWKTNATMFRSCDCLSSSFCV